MTTGAWETRSPTVAEVAPTDRELRAEVPSLEWLHHRRRELKKEWKPLEAMYGGSRGQGSPSDAARKRHRDFIATEIEKTLRAQHEEMKTRAKTNTALVIGDFKQPSEAYLERLANAHPDHIAKCKEMQKDVERLLELENDIDEIQEQIRSREIELYSYNKEIGLQ